MKPILGYWDLRGRANSIRMLLNYVKKDFEDKRYSLQDFDEWFKKDKVDLHGTMDFPNLPYYIDGNIKISHTRAILHYIGRKYMLEGESDVELARMDVIFEQVLELMNSLVSVAHPPNVDNRKEIHDLQRKEYVTNLHGKLDAIVKFLGSDDWMAGSRLTYDDFYDILLRHSFTTFWTSTADFFCRNM